MRRGSRSLRKRVKSRSSRSLRSRRSLRRQRSKNMRGGMNQRKRLNAGPIFDRDYMVQLEKNFKLQQEEKKFMDFANGIEYVNTDGKDKQVKLPISDNMYNTCVVDEDNYKKLELDVNNDIERQIKRQQEGDSFYRFSDSNPDGFQNPNGRDKYVNLPLTDNIYNKCISKGLWDKYLQ